MNNRAKDRVWERYFEEFAVLAELRKWYRANEPPAATAAKGTARRRADTGKSGKPDDHEQDGHAEAIAARLKVVANTLNDASTDSQEWERRRQEYGVLAVAHKWYCANRLTTGREETLGHSGPGSLPSLETAMGVTRAGRGRRRRPPSSRRLGK